MGLKALARSGEVLRKSGTNCLEKVKTYMCYLSGDDCEKPAGDDCEKPAGDGCEKPAGDDSSFVGVRGCLRRGLQGLILIFACYIPVHGMWKLRVSRTSCFFWHRCVQEPSTKHQQRHTAFDTKPAETKPASQVCVCQLAHTYEAIIHVYMCKIALVLQMKETHVHFQYWLPVSQNKNKKGLCNTCIYLNTAGYDISWQDIQHYIEYKKTNMTLNDIWIIYNDMARKRMLGECKLKLSEGCFGTTDCIRECMEWSQIGSQRLELR